MRGCDGWTNRGVPLLVSVDAVAIPTVMPVSLIHAGILSIETGAGGHPRTRSIYSCAACHAAIDAVKCSRAGRVMP